jgi:type II secretory pathway pseudopilin PulG
MKNKGFTLIEIILYVALVAVFITSAILFTFNIIYGKEKAYNQQVVDQSARILMDKIAYQIRSAKQVQNMTPDSITLVDVDGNTISIALNGTVVEITTNGLGPYSLTSNQVKVDSFTLTDLSGASANTNNVNVDLGISQSKITASGQLTASTALSESVEFNSQLNE